MVYLALVAALPAAIGGAAAWGTVMRKPRRIEPIAAAHLNPQSVVFTGAEGTQLRGWFILPPVKMRGFVVMCHGVDSDRTALLTAATALFDVGIGSLLYDARARGESGGDRCTLGRLEAKDALLAVEYVKTRQELKGIPLGIQGESLGGAVAILAAAENKDLRAVVAESPFAQLDHAVQNNFRKAFGPLGPLFAWPADRVGTSLTGTQSSSISPVSVIGALAPRPILLIEDSLDDLCPPSETQALARAAGSNARVWAVPGARHVMAQSAAPEEYRDRIEEFWVKIFELER